MKRIKKHKNGRRKHAEGDKGEEGDKTNPLSFHFVSVSENTGVKELSDCRVLICQLFGGTCFLHLHARLLHLHLASRQLLA
jgi:hypothetical protein